jgi:hypothetical protein
LNPDLPPVQAERVVKEIAMSEPITGVTRDADPSFRPGVNLGQPVRLATDPSGRPGHVVAVMLTPPHEALVRWRGAEATFEALDDLIELAP